MRQLLRIIDPEALRPEGLQRNARNRRRWLAMTPEGRAFKRLSRVTGGWTPTRAEVAMARVNQWQMAR
jgi:hypothetical protein